MDKGRGYDRETGQVFSEWVEKRLELADQEWHRRTPYPMPQTRGGIGKRGARPLMDMCITIIASNINDIERETIQHVPDRIILLLLEYLKAKSRGMSFRTWKLFLARLSTHEPPMTEELTRCRHEIAMPQAPFKFYIEPMISSSFEFLVDLTIAGSVVFDEHELLRLTDLVNLRSLNFIKSAAFRFPRISDRLVREWSVKSVAFPRLRQLTISGDGLTTFQSLPYVARFPVLQVYHVTGDIDDWPLGTYHAAWSCTSEPVALRETGEPVAAISLGKESPVSLIVNYENPAIITKGSKSSIRQSVECFFERKPVITAPGDPDGDSNVRSSNLHPEAGPRPRVLAREPGPRLEPRSVPGMSGITRDPRRRPAKKLKGVRDLLAEFGT